MLVMLVGSSLAKQSDGITMCMYTTDFRQLHMAIIKARSDQSARAKGPQPEARRAKGQGQGGCEELGEVHPAPFSSCGFG